MGSKKGSERKELINSIVTLQENFLKILADFTAGDLMDSHPDRNVRFEKITKLKAQYLDNAEPMISIDIKKKELISNFWCASHTHTQAPVQTLDHDLPSTCDAKLIPHGLYDLARNTSSDSSEFCCDSKVSNRYVFKGALQKLADHLGLEIRIARYLPYCCIIFDAVLPT